MPKCRDAKLLQVLSRQARKNRFVNLVLAERSLILSKTKAPQPNHDVHDGARASSWSISSSEGLGEVLERRWARRTAKGPEAASGGKTDSARTLLRVSSCHRLALAV